MIYKDFRIINQTELKILVESLAIRIGAPDYCLPTFDFAKGDATPYIEFIKDGYYYIISERGNEFERRYTALLDELLFWIFDSVTFFMACNYELNNRIKGQDSRLLIFRHQIELIEKINPDYIDVIEKKAKFLLGKMWDKK